MKKVILLAIASCLFIVENVQSQTQIEGKYWVESIDSPSDRILLLKAQKNYTANEDTPFSPAVFYFKQGQVELIDSRWCAGMQTQGKLTGNWARTDDKVNFVIGDCSNSFLIKKASEEEMLIEIL